MILRANYSKWNGGCAVFYLDEIQHFLNTTKIRCKLSNGDTLYMYPPFDKEFKFVDLIDKKLYKAILEYEINGNNEFIFAYELGFVCKRIEQLPQSARMQLRKYSAGGISNIPDKKINNIILGGDDNVDS